WMKITSSADMRSENEIQYGSPPSASVDDRRRGDLTALPFQLVDCFRECADGAEHLARIGAAVLVPHIHPVVRLLDDGPGVVVQPLGHRCTEALDLRLQLGNELLLM